LDIVEIFCVIMFFIGFYGLVTCKSILKSIISIAFVETAVIMFFLSLGYTDGVLPPIGQDLSNVADPVPQALMITAIVIGVAVTAINLIMLISLCRQSHSSDWDAVKKENTK